MSRDRVAAIVIYKDKVLLMFRRNNGKEYFTFPGGGIEAGETLEQALARELQEETSVIATPEKHLYDVEWDQKSHQHFFLCSYQSGQPKLGDSIEKEVMKKDKNQYYDPRWMRLKDLSQLLVYPLEVKDEFLQDVIGTWPNKTKRMHLKLSTCRQRL